MKTIKMMIATVILAVFSISMLTAQNINDSQLLNITEIKVKHGHTAQFIEGVKKWKECYLNNNGKDKWNMWRRIQGEGTVYLMTGFVANWAEMDKEDSAGIACRNTLMDLIMPHIEKVTSRIARTMPELSRARLEDTKVVWVTNYKVKNNTDFMEIITAIGQAIRDKEGSFRGYWYNNLGGDPGSADYFVSTPYKGFADLDIARDSPLKIYTDAKGQKNSDEMRAKWRAAVEDSWSYILTLNSELSN